MYLKILERITLNKIYTDHPNTIAPALRQKQAFVPSM